MRRLLLLWRVGRQDLLVLWRALHHPGRPAWLLPAVGVLSLFALDPANVALPVLGAFDELLILPLLLRALVSCLPAALRQASGDTSLHRP